MRAFSVAAVFASMARAQATDLCDIVMVDASLIQEKYIDYPKAVIGYTVGVGDTRTSFTDVFTDGTCDIYSISPKPLGALNYTAGALVFQFNLDDGCVIEGNATVDETPKTVSCNSTKDSFTVDFIKPVFPTAMPTANPTAAPRLTSAPSPSSSTSLAVHLTLILFTLVVAV